MKKFILILIVTSNMCFAEDFYSMPNDDQSYQADDYFQNAYQNLKPKQAPTGFAALQPYSGN